MMCFDLLFALLKNIFLLIGSINKIYCKKQKKSITTVLKETLLSIIKQRRHLNDVKDIFAWIYRVCVLFHGNFAFPPEIRSGFCFADKARISLFGYWTNEILPFALANNEKRPAATLKKLPCYK